MKVILDTNVVVSGIFFGGIPRRILELGQKRVFTNVISHEILDEYTEVVKRVAEQYSVFQAEKILDSVVAGSDLTFSILLKEPVCADPKDDKFISAAGYCEICLPKRDRKCEHDKALDLLICKPSSKKRKQINASQ